MDIKTLMQKYWRFGFYLPLLLLGGEFFLNTMQVIASRIHYPFELEWIEGGILQQVLRVVQHQPLYGEPSLQFVPALYMPLYYYFSALSVYVFGANFFALRLVSVLALIGIFVLAYGICFRIAASRLAALLAVFLCAAAYPLVGFWFDVARVDTLWVMGLLLSWWCLLCWRDAPASHFRLIAFALVSVLVFFTKQASLFVLPFVVTAIVCWLGWRAAGRYLWVCTLFGLPLLVALEFSTGGHFWFYTLQMASKHGVTAFGWRRFAEIVLWNAPILIFFALPVFFVLIGKNQRDKYGWIALIAGFVFISGLSRAYAGAFYNVLMPLYICLAIVAASTLALLLQRVALARSVGAGALAVLFAAALVWNMTHWRFNPEKQIPQSRDIAATQFLLDKLRGVHGKVCVTSHGYLGWMAGKDFCAHNTQVTDLVRGSSPALADVLRADAREKILSGYYAVIVLDREQELRDLGLRLADIPYTVTKIHYPEGPLWFPVNGYSPTFWLEKK